MLRVSFEVVEYFLAFFKGIENTFVFIQCASNILQLLVVLKS